MMQNPGNAEDFEKVLNGTPWAEFLSASYDNRRYAPIGSLGRSPRCFKEMDSLEIREGWKKTLSLIGQGLAPREIGLYIHWPFCPSRCSFCHCSMATSRNQESLQAALTALKEEMNFFKPIFRDFDLSSLYIGGGTPTFMDDPSLDDFLSHIFRSFRFTPGAEIYTESSPSTLTASKLAILLRHGFNRIAFGIQTFDDDLLKRLNRQGQTRKQTIEMFKEISRVSNLTTDIDLIIGLEGQSPGRFVKDMDEALSLRPNCMHVYLFNDAPWTEFRLSGKTLSASQHDQALHCLSLADHMALKAGYHCDECKTAVIYSSESETEAPWRRGVGSILGLGYNALSHAFGSLWYSHVPTPQGLFLPRIPAYFARRFNLIEEMRAYAIGFLAEQSFLSRDSFKTLFGQDILSAEPLAVPLRDLVDLKALHIGPRRISWIITDPVRRALLVKRLYDPSVVKSLLASEADAFRNFKEQFNRGDQSWKRAILNMGSYPDCHIYYNSSPQRPANHVGRV